MVLLQYYYKALSLLREILKKEKKKASGYHSC